MFRLAIFCLGTILIAFTACTSDRVSKKEVSTNLNQLERRSFAFGDTVNVSVEAPVEPDSIRLVHQGVNLASPAILTERNFDYGNNSLICEIYFGKRPLRYAFRLGIFSPLEVQLLEYEVVDEYYHDPSLFTEGLIYMDGKILESAGLKEKSRLVYYELGKREFISSRQMQGDIFAEGITLWNADSLFQLTWQNRKIFIYTFPDFEPVGELPMPSFLKEGWGMTTDGRQLIASDGTDRLSFFEAGSLTLNRSITAVGKKQVYDNLNELEYFDGMILANVWLTDYFIILDAQTGFVRYKIDLSELSQPHKSKGELNGIAIKDGNLLITGKNWPVMYEIRLNGLDFSSPRTALRN